ncbi:peptidase M23 [Echinicola pacifica]|uniref:Peptidase M23 n=1 Tax=Echinicola pacifica TaxID=346377 RepID=A0A918PRA7_9BACT|nr:peptidoglycan DD-metalloendopeptidase family protein [Echinicola pacifica]GGZ19143.1 peptidase M23 [Echinicola pacifica]
MKKSWIAAAGLVLMMAAGYGLYEYSLRPAVEEESVVAVSPESKPNIVHEANFLYGINVDDFKIVDGVVGRNQTLSTLLAPFDVPYQVIDRIAKKSRDIFDVRKIAFNKKYTVLTSKDSSSKAAFFIYEPNAAEYVVYKLDGNDIYKESKPIELRKREVGGTISSSLYVNMTEQGITPDLIDEFADLYGWSVDFQRLQKGDKFKVVYNEKLVDGQVVGIEPIQVAYFEHMGQPYHAIPFEQNGQVTFFDIEGNSFKKAFLRDPVKFTRISSRYNLRRYHPVQKRYKAHLGTDYAAPRGTEIRAVGDGTIIAASYTGGNGNYVKVKHNGTYTTQYLHMSKIASGIRNGVRVKQGQVIGYVGSTGLATGPHLCFRFWKNGKQVDWLNEEIPPSDPILQENQMAFDRAKTEKLDQLASIPYIESLDGKLVTEVVK